MILFVRSRGSPDCAARAVPIDAAWTNDQSFDAAGVGGGDYTPGATHGLPLIATGLAPYGHDQLGRVIADNGTAVTGAIQR